MFAVIHKVASLCTSRTSFCAENKILCDLIFAIFTVTANSQNLVPRKYFWLYVWYTGHTFHSNYLVISSVLTFHIARNTCRALYFVFHYVRNISTVLYYASLLCLFYFVLLILYVLPYTGKFSCRFIFTNFANFGQSQN